MAGPASAAILGSDGSFSLHWDTRGAPLEWGGVYAQGVRLTGPWELSIGPEGSPTDLGPATLRSFRRWRWGVESRHELPGLEVTDEVLPLEGFPGIGRRLTLRRTAPGPELLQVHSKVRPSLGHVLIEGVQPFEYEVSHHGPTLRLRAYGAGLAIDSDPVPNATFIDGRAWTGGDSAGPIRSIGATYNLAPEPGDVATLAWVLWGGRLSTIVAGPDVGRAALAYRDQWRSRARESRAEWDRSIPRMLLPDAPKLEEGYGLAAGALRDLYSSPEPGMTGLLAGYPWYAALWFRDLAWMLPAVLWMGDVERVAASLETAFHYQAPADLAMLGAVQGELPMQLSPGPIFLFGTSDTTLYYPGILRRLVHHTGELDRALRYRTALGHILDWGVRKTHPRTDLITNGGEVEALEGASHEVGRVQFGIDANDTTIWDSTDRRDHAIDVQVLWGEALDALAELGEAFGDGPSSALREKAATLRATIVARYRWPAEEYLYDSLRHDGTPVAKVRPNALRAVEAGVFDRATSLEILDRAGRDDLSTPWGLRTLSNRDPGYDPQAYHDGQVWSIATAWAAAAAFAVGRPETAVGYLRTIADRLCAEGGYANECYRGDAPTAFDSCFLLGFSVAPYLTTLFEGLWGLQPRLVDRTVRCQPNFPAGWTSASLTGLRLGPGRLDLAWTPSALTATWQGPWPLQLANDRTSVLLRPGTPGTLPLREPSSP
ncbi:MAG: hypothetical protein L3K00_06790 [Thermoplasmata archaeon]|nr:hypothetical protein [Thermoplasmata archaeon]